MQIGICYGKCKESFLKNYRPLRNKLVLESEETIMRKGLKKIVAFVLTAAMTMSVGMPAFAMDSNFEKNITIEEYEAALNAEAQKYGCSYEITEYNSGVIITSAMLEKGIEKVKYLAENTTVEVAESWVEENSARVIPVEKTVKGGMDISYPTGATYIEITSEVTVDEQNGAVISVNSTEIEPEYMSVNLDSWQTKSYSYSINSPQIGWISYHVIGKLGYTLAGDLIGTAVFYKDVDKVVNIDCFK